jgi:hypothetical protein
MAGRKNMFDDEPSDEERGVPRITVRPQPSFTPAQRNITPPRGNMFDAEPVPQPKSGFNAFSPQQFNRPFGELKPRSLAPSEQVQSWGQDALMAAGANPYVAGKLSRAYSDIGRAFTPMGAILSGADMPYHINKGQYGAAAFDAIGAIPGVTSARRAIPEGRMGSSPMPTVRTAETPVINTSDYARRAQEGGPAAQRRAAYEASQPNMLPAVLPQGLENSARAAYRFSERSPLEYHPDAVANYVDRARAYLQSPYHGQGTFSPEKAGEAFATLERAAQAFPRGGNRPVTASDFDTLRQQLQGLPGPSGPAGHQAVNVLDTFMLRPPQGMLTRGTPQDIAALENALMQARGDWRAAKTSEGVADAVDYALIKAGRANSGQNPGNTTRQELSKFVSSPSGENRLIGATDAERAAITDAVMGDRTTNLLRSGSTLFGGGGGLQRGLAGAGGAGTGAYLASHFGLDPWTSMAVTGTGAVAAPLAGALMRSGANARTIRAGEEVAGDIARNSPLFRAREAVSPPVADPTVGMRDRMTMMMMPAFHDKGIDLWNEDQVPFANR